MEMNFITIFVQVQERKKKKRKKKEDLIEFKLIAFAS